MPADGFYECLPWPPKVRCHFRPPDGQRLELAGLWDVWAPPGGEKLATCRVLSVPTNGTVGPVQGRMPLVLDPADDAR